MLSSHKELWKRSFGWVITAFAVAKMKSNAEILGQLLVKQLFYFGEHFWATWEIVSIFLKYLEHP